MREAKSKVCWLNTGSSQHRLNSHLNQVLRNARVESIGTLPGHTHNSMLQVKWLASTPPRATLHPCLPRKRSEAAAARMHRLGNLTTGNHEHTSLQNPRDTQPNPAHTTTIKPKDVLLPSASNVPTLAVLPNHLSQDFHAHHSTWYPVA